MSLTIYQVDAFASRPFEGNPAAVCVLPEARSEKWMQLVAAEMNLSETAFLVRRGDGSFDLRWFTPSLEVKLCGHATLASAHVLWETGALGPQDEARFHTQSGLLTARRAADGWIEMDFPAHPVESRELPSEIFESLGRPALRFSGAKEDNFLVELESPEAVRALKPDFGQMLRAAKHLVIATAAAPEGAADRMVDQMIVATAPGQDGFDFVSRVFAPAAGIDEDPVTGSAHCLLAPYWAGRLGKKELLGRQISRRGGTVRVRDAGNRTILGGQAIATLRGELLGDAARG